MKNKDPDPSKKKPAELNTIAGSLEAAFQTHEEPSPVNSEKQFKEDETKISETLDLLNGKEFNAFTADELEMLKEAFLASLRVSKYKKNKS